MRLAHELNMEFELRLNWSSSYSPAFKSEHLATATRKQFFQENGVNYKREICKQLWINPQINWDGKVLGCCNNYWQPFEGNAFKVDLLTLLNLPLANDSREMLLGTKDCTKGNPCSNCKKYTDLKESKKWLTMSEVYNSNGNAKI